MADVHDLVIVGGGLAGLTAAYWAERQGASVVLVDAGVPGTPGGLGGFAPFSGAKFSLAPAGTGIAPLVGGREALVRLYREACLDFAGLGFGEFQLNEKQFAGDESEIGNALAYRGYHSVLLSPERIDQLLSAMAGRLTRANILRGQVQRIDVSSGAHHYAMLENGNVIAARSMVVAAGRLGAELLQAAGVPETRGKGIDVGVRLGFDSMEPVAALRSLGPDAKIMADGVRTFCLNSPGKIFHYPGLGYQIPGGIVADAGWAEANVGILCRLDDRRDALAHFMQGGGRSESPIVLKGSGLDLGWRSSVVNVMPPEVVVRINGFVERLVGLGLIKLPGSYDVHLPLLDWHWPVFSLPGRLETGVGGVFAAGDVSGHARGLLQAIVMGRLAVEEALS